MKLNEMSGDMELVDDVIKYLSDRHNSVEAMKNGLEKALTVVLGSRGKSDMRDAVRKMVIEKLPSENPKHRNIAGQIPGRSSPISSQSEVRSPMQSGDDWSEDEIIKAHDRLKKRG